MGSLLVNLVSAIQMDQPTSTVMLMAGVLVNLATLDKNAIHLQADVLDGKSLMEYVTIGFQKDLHGIKLDIDVQTWEQFWLNQEVLVRREQWHH